VTGRPPKRAIVLANSLRGRILRGELAVGASLPTERELTEQSNVSRFTLREALRVLESEGLLEIQRGVGGGPRVRHPDIATTALAVGVQLQLRDVPIMDAWVTRSDLVRAAVHDLAQRPTAATIEVLEGSVDRLAAFATEAEFVERWIELTEVLAERAGSQTRYVLVRALHEIVTAQLEAATHAASKVQAERFRAEVIESCRAIVGHIGAGDAIAAGAKLDEQTRSQTEGMFKLFGSTAIVDIL
jgi:GntR family transcriptional repressor for pyruvate dehydrogenase complex